MQELVRAFCETIKEKPHLFELFRDSSGISILMKMENEEYGFELDPLNANESTTEEFIINGSFEAFKELINGSNKLRYLVENDRLELKTSFRNLLKLESIFFLGAIGSFEKGSHFRI